MDLFSSFIFRAGGTREVVVLLSRLIMQKLGQSGIAQNHPYIAHSEAVVLSLFFGRVAPAEIPVAELVVVSHDERAMVADKRLPKPVVVAHDPTFE